MNNSKIDKKDVKMKTLIVETNQHLRDFSVRRQNGLDAALASSKLEGVNISRELAMEISDRVEAEIRRYLG